MSLFQIAAILITLAALFSYLNHRLIRLPTTMGLMLISLVISLGFIVAGQYGLSIEEAAENLVSQIDFNKTLMQGMLSFLLFAGALHIDLESLYRHKWTIGALATIGVLLSTFMIGGSVYLLFGMLELPLPFIYCLIFGALISPTDPIAVLGLLKQAKAPESLETKIAGESLFNDGVGIVVFLVIYEIVTGEHAFEITHVGVLLIQEALGGIALGLLLGWLTYLMLKSIDNYQVEVLLTLALVTGGYALASTLHMSGPLAIVAAGLLIGNHGRHMAMSGKTRDHLDTFWELVDETLNAILFVLIGLEILILTLETNFIIAAILTIPIVLLSRFLSVGLTVNTLRLVRDFSPHVIKIMTWGGLRGGISVALALSLPTGPERDFLLTVTYGVVVFSILVQGLTVKPLLRRILPTPDLSQQE
jgi:CPA1 family monovalent cation:H+ antiporter